MSDSEEENLATFGVPLDPLDEESLPRKRAATIENQYAYDAQGRRRFHGAFTGGFSAGYFNTVGTRDGWRPQQFKSSRGNKAKNVEQQPEDFMDEEDVSVFGIAPKGIRACKDYEDHGQRGTKRDRTKLLNNTIPGNPILKELLRPVKETVGIVLLKKMGWKPGQGVGNRVTKKAKMKARQNTEQIKVYGCSLQQEQQKLVDSDSEDTDDENTSITFAPDDYEPFQCNAKDNYFGIGYSGLNKQNVLSNQLNLIDVPEFHVHVNSKKIPIYGQAFGVGAFEAEDEDIYQEEDMSRYDIMLGSECKTKSRWSQDNSSSKKEIDCLEGFQPAQSKMDRRKRFVSPELPKDFKAVHLVRRSRFYPPILRKSYSSRKEELNAVDRARILKDIDPTSNVSREHLVTDSSTDRNTSVICNIVSKTLNLPRKSSIIEKQNLETQGAKKEVSWMDKLRSEKFTKGGIVGSELEKGVKGSNSATTSVKTEGEIIKPFLSDSDKQNRFEQFCNFPVDDRSKRLDGIQPLSMSEWDRNNEYTEFVQAERLLRPASSNVENKFVASTVPSVATTATEVANISSNQMEDAAKIEMFGTLTREKIEWKPSSIVCKRFNVPQPKSGCAEPETNKVTHFSVFGSILDSSMDDKFLKSTDTPFTKAENETSVLSTNIVSNLSEDSKDTTSIDDGEKSDILSQKIKHFETSYEKIFGKTIDNASAANVKDSKQNHSYDGKNEGNHANEDLENLSNLEKETETTSAVVTVADKNSEEKKDLFKAIFLSSSDESEAELENDIDVSEVVKSVLIGETSSEIKPQKNTSPPRGIFAKLDLDDLMVQSRDITKQPMENTIQGSQDMDVVVKTEPEVLVHSDNGNKDYNNTMEISNPSGMYGPVLPSRLIKNESTSATEESNSESSKSAFKSVVIPKIKDKQQQYGRWVEQRKSKKSKKEKRKHKHKEHKSPKHKKRSKKDKR